MSVLTGFGHANQPSLLTACHELKLSDQNIFIDTVLLELDNIITLCIWIPSHLVRHDRLCHTLLCSCHVNVVKQQHRRCSLLLSLGGGDDFANLHANKFFSFFFFFLTVKMSNEFVFCEVFVPCPSPIQQCDSQVMCHVCVAKGDASLEIRKKVGWAGLCVQAYASCAERWV